MVKASKKNLLTHKEPANKEHLTQLAEQVQCKNLKIVKRQNQNYVKQHASNSKRRRGGNDSDESESDQIVKKCYEEWLKEEAAKESITPKVEENDSESDKVAEESYKNWREDEYDTYSAINRKTLLSKIDMFEKMIKPAKKVDCGLTSGNSDSDDKIMWTSPTYIARYIRKCILRHEWTELAHLLLLLTKHSHLYESYTREMAFLATLMSTDKCEKDLLADLELCFVTEKAQEAKEFDVWYVEKSANNTDDG